MTDSWDTLFERASEHDVSQDDVRTRLEAVRDGGTDPSTDSDGTDAGDDDA